MFCQPLGVLRWGHHGCGIEPAHGGWSEAQAQLQHHCLDLVHTFGKQSHPRELVGTIIGCSDGVLAFAMLGSLADDKNSDSAFVPLLHSLAMLQISNHSDTSPFANDFGTLMWRLAICGIDTQYIVVLRTVLCYQCSHCQNSNSALSQIHTSLYIKSVVPRMF